MGQKCVIVGVNLPNTTNLEYELNELKLLCEACDIECIDTITQNLEEINTSTYIGKGKIEEIKTSLISNDVNLIVCNDELSPSQIANLETALEAIIYDRTFIILEIFKRRAKTKEAYLQVELASLKYLMPRLSGMRKGLSRQGGSSGGNRSKGLGETKLELDRRLTSDKISFIKSELAQLTSVRKEQRKSRKDNDMKVVSLVGYTNSGKSSTLNALLSYSSGIKKEVFQKNMLFATLETYTRSIKLHNNHSFLITDTVGFVEKLPHHLVEAFKSTLEEITESDLILHVVDASNIEYERQIHTTNKVLEELGVKDIPVVYVFNKTDKVDGYFYIPNNFSNAIRISAEKQTNLDELLKIIESHLFEDYEISIKIPFNRGDIVNTLKRDYNVTSLTYLDDGIYIKAYVSKKMYEKLKEFTCKF